MLVSDDGDDDNEAAANTHSRHILLGIVRHLAKTAL